MEQEQIKEINKKILDAYKNFIDELEEKINALKGNLSNLESELDLDESIKESLKEVYKDLSGIRTNVLRTYNNMLQKNNKNIPLFLKKDKYKSIFVDTKYQNNIDNEIEKAKTVDQQIDAIVVQKDNIKSTDKLSEHAKGALDNIIMELRNKKGRIQDKQSKIVDKAIKEKLNAYRNKISSQYKLANRVNKLEKSKSIFDEKLSNAIELNTNFNNKIKGLSLVNKTKIKFVSKLNSTRILSLKTKKGIIKSTEKQIIKKNIHPSFLQKMKTKAIDLGKRFSKGAKAFWDAMTEPVVEEETLRTR